MTGMELHTPLHTAASAARDARQTVRAALAQWQIPGCLDDALLIVTELVSNALRHGAAPIELDLRLTDQTLRIAVSDALPARAPTPLQSDTAQASGRGLLLIAATSARWGWDTGRQSKTVWAEMDCPMPEETPDA
jgi:anti-sigma regulatory factor (Ser/Thr protein kinase)